jgi:hypothetical protein
MLIPDLDRLGQEAQGVRCLGGCGRVDCVSRPSAYPSIAGISLHCRELAVWAKSGRCSLSFRARVARLL